jgi:hypothetical protein
MTKTEMFQIRHFHFLRDAGKDLLEPAYRQLRGCLRRHTFSTRLGELARQARQLLAEQADARAENPGSADLREGDLPHYVRDYLRRRPIATPSSIPDKNPPSEPPTP